MRGKYLGTIFFLFVLLGFGGMALAYPVTDTCGDALVGDADIESAEVELYSYPSISRFYGPLTAYN